MKRILSLALCTAIAVSGCTSQGGIAGDPAAVMLGANIGGLTGAIVGSSSGPRHHAGRGALVGALVGTVAGAAIASAATSGQPEEDAYAVRTRPYREPERVPHRRGVPVPELEIRNIRFIDDNRNHVIESGEEAKIIFEVVNVGQADAFHVTPVVAEKSGLRNLSVSAPVTLECIPAGDGIRYTALVRAGRMRRGEAVFHVTALDADGLTVAAREFAIPVER